MALFTGLGVWRNPGVAGALRRRESDGEKEVETVSQLLRQKRTPA